MTDVRRFQFPGTFAQVVQADDYDKLATDYATLEAELERVKGEYEWVASINTALDESNQSAWAENAKLRAALERRADGWKLVPVERIKVALECVQNAMEDAYNNAYQECCGRGQGQCCGEPVSAWSAEDTAIMDALAPAQRELSSLLAAAPSAPKADDPVKVQLLEALEEILYAEINSPISMNNAGCIKKMQGIARAAIAAARKGEGE